MATSFLEEDEDLDWRSAVRDFLATSTGPQRTFSKAGLDTLKEREGGFYDAPYGDAGNLAIGYGQQFWQGKRVTPDMRVTQPQADEEFQRQIDTDYGKSILDNLKVPVSQNQLDALLSVRYNHPETAKRIIAKLNAGQQPDENDFMWSATVGGVPNAGLQKRRQAEFAQFSAADAPAPQADWRSDVRNFLAQSEAAPFGPEWDVVNRAARTNIGAPPQLPPSASDIEKEIIRRSPATLSRQRGPMAEGVPGEAPQPIMQRSRTGQMVPTGEETPGRPAAPSLAEQYPQAFNKYVDTEQQITAQNEAPLTLWGKLTTAPKAITEPVRAGTEAVAQGTANVPREQFADLPAEMGDPATTAGFVAGAAQAVSNMATPLNIMLTAVSGGLTAIEGRIATLSNEARILTTATQAAKTEEDFALVAQALAETGDRLQKLELLKTTLQTGQAAAGVPITAEGVDRLVHGPTALDRLQGFAEAAGGVTAVVGGAQALARPRPQTQALLESINRPPPPPAEPINVTPGGGPTQPRPGGRGLELPPSEPVTPGAPPAPPGPLPVTPKVPPPTGGLPPAGAPPQAPVSPGGLSTEEAIDRLRRMHADLQKPDHELPLPRAVIEQGVRTLTDLLTQRGVNVDAISEQGPVEGGVQRGARPSDETQGPPVGAREPELQQPPVKEKEAERTPPPEVGEFRLTPPKEKPPVTPKEEPPITRAELERAGQLLLDFSDEGVSKISSKEIVARIKAEREARRKAREKEAPQAEFELTAPGEMKLAPEEPPTPAPITRAEREAGGQLALDFTEPPTPPPAPAAVKSYKVEATDGSGYASNGLRFATPEEAEAYGHDLMGRWMAAKDFRVVESDEPVAHRWDKDNGLVYLDREPKPAPPVTPKTEPAPAPQEKPVTYFRSGVRRAPADFEGLQRAGVPIGVTAHNMSLDTELRVRDYTNAGGKVFVDSGALGKFLGRKDAQNLDFNKVLDTYQRLANHGTPGNLFVVAPDVVGDAAATRELQQKYVDRLGVLRRRGANIIVPLQKGEPLADQMTKTVGLVFGGSDKGVVFGIPFNKEAFTAEDVAAALKQYGRPARIHLLGMGEQHPKFKESIATIRAAAPDVDISADSNRMTAMFGEGRKGTKAVEEGAAEEADSTELWGELSRGSFDSFSVPEVERIAEAMNSTPSVLRGWAKRSPEKLHDALVEHERELDPLLEEFARTRARPKVRSDVIAEQEGEQPTAPVTLKGDVEVASAVFKAVKKNPEAVLIEGNAGDVRKRIAKVMGISEDTLKDHTRAYEDGIEAALADTLAGDYEKERVSLDQPVIQQIKHALKVEEMMPRAHRGIDKSKLQQFSTPLPIGVAAIYAAKVRDTDRVLEPTAGTGNLLVSLPERTKVQATDIDPHRAALLAEQGYGSPEPQDYLKTKYPPDISSHAPSVIITNPPWGKYSTAKYGNVPGGLGFDPNDVAERFIAKNMRDLQTGGRLVAIMPTTMLDQKSVPFRRWLSNHYFVRAVVMSPPNSYDTRGTKVDSVLLVVDKVTDETIKGHMPAIQRPASWEAFADAIQAIPGRSGAEPRTGEAPRAPEGAGGSGRTGGQLPVTPKSGPDVEVSGRAPGVVDEGGEGAPAKPQAPVAPKSQPAEGGGRAEGAEGEPGSGVEDEVKRKAEAARQRLKEIAKKRQKANAELPTDRGDGELGMALGAQSDDEDDALEAMVDTLRAIIHDGVTDFRRAIIAFEKDFGPEWQVFKEELELAWHALQGERTGMDEARPVDDALNEDVKVRIEKSPDWRPYYRRTALDGAPHPKAIVEAKQLSGVPYPKLVYVDNKTGKIPEHIVRAVANGWASVEQGEQALAAVQANSSQRPEGYPLGNKPHGFLIADAVGVGKSREIALAVNEIMRASDDETRLLVVTKSRGNLEDLIQNFAYMWSGFTEDGIDLNTGKRVEGQAGTTPYKIVNLYEWKDSKSKPDVAEPKPLPKYKKAIYITTSYNLADYYYALSNVGLSGIIGDEAHTYKNVWGAQRGRAWQGLHAQIFKSVPRDQQKFVYATATPTQDILDYEYLYGMRLWPIDGFDDWVQLITGRLDADAAKSIEEDSEKGIKDPDRFRPPSPTGEIAKDQPDPHRGGGASTVDLRAITSAELEQIPRELKIMGRMSARDLWREGLEFQIHKAQLSAKHKQQLDEFGELARDILDAVVSFGKQNQRSNPGKAIMMASSMLQFAAKRFALQPAMEEAIRVAQEAVKTGFQPVIRVINVGRIGNVKDVGDDGEGEEDDAMYDVPLNGHLPAAINAINTRDVEVDDDGNDLHDEEIPEAVEVIGRLRERARKFVMEAPLDMMNKAFGEENVAVKIGKTSKALQQTVKDFQMGRRKVMLISAAGSTGINLDHRVMTKPPKGHEGEWTGGRRMFINAQFDWSATEEVQAIGRVDRASSITPAFIKPITFGNAAEVRFLANIANRMASLGATSRGGAQATGGAKGLGEFEVGGPEMIAGIRDAWLNLDDHVKSFFWGKRFRDPRDPMRSARTLPDRITAEDVQRAMLFVPIDLANKFWADALKNREEIKQHTSYGEDARTKAWSGEILSKSELTPNLLLYKVKNEAGHKFGLLVGLIMPEMPRLKPFLPINPNGTPKRSYVSFASTDPETGKPRTITGLEVLWTRTGAIAQEFGKDFEQELLDTPDKVLDALKSGEKVPLKQRTESSKKRWVLRLNKSQHIVIDHATFADKDLIVRHGGFYREVGSFWYVKPDRFPEFIERFPPASPAELRAEKAGSKPPEGGGEPSGGEGGAQGFGTQAYGTGEPQMPQPPLGPMEEPRPGRRGKQSLMDWVKRRPTKEKKPSEFFQKLRERHHLPIRVGGFRSNLFGKLIIHGLYHTRSRVIQLRVANRVPIIAHEVGHHLDNIYGFWTRHRNATWKYELVALGENTSGKTFPIKRKVMEGVAEFTRLWLTDPTEAQKKAPTFYADFERTLEGELKKDMLDLQSDIQDWVKLSYPDRLGTHIDMDGGDLDADNRDFIDKFNEKVMNDLGRIDQAVDAMVRPDQVLDNSALLSQMSRGSASVAHGFIEHGIKRKDGSFASKGLREILKPVAKRQDEFTRYIVALRARELHNRHRETGIDPNAMVATINTYKDEPHFEEARKDLLAFTTALLNYLREHGIIGVKEYNAMLEAGKYYVPFSRIMDGYDAQKGEGQGRRIANRMNPLKRYLGSGRDIINPIESIIRNVYTAVDTVMQNDAMQALVRQAERTAGSGRWMHKIVTPVKPTFFDLDRLAKDIRKAMKKNKVDLPADLDLHRVVSVWLPSRPDPDQGIITVMRNGKREYWQVNDKALYNALVALGPKSAHPLVQLFLAPGANLVRATATALNVSFGTRNIIRDMLVAHAQGKAYGFKYRDTWIGLARALYGSHIKADEMFKHFETSGVMNSAIIGNDRREIQRQIRKLTGTKHDEFWGRMHDTMMVPTHFVQAITEYGEMATRYGAFLRSMNNSKRDGIPMAEALARATVIARNSTQDFSIGGEYTRTMNTMTAFLGARIGGWRQFGKTLAGDSTGGVGGAPPPKGPVGKALGKLPPWARGSAALVERMVMTIMLFSIGLWLMRQLADDDTKKMYEELPDWEKNNFWHIRAPYTDSGWIRIPKPFELGLFFGTIPELMLDYAYQRDGQEVIDRLKEAFNLSGGGHALGLLSLPVWLLFEIAPSQALPWLEVGTNYYHFRDRPVVNPDDEGLDPDLLKTRWTSQTAIKTAAIWNEAMRAAGFDSGQIAPVQLEHIMYSYFGGAGRSTAQAIDWTLANIAGTANDMPAQPVSRLPIVSSFYQEGFDQTAHSIQELYKQHAKVAGLVRSIRKYDAQGKELRADQLDTENQELLDSETDLNAAVAEMKRLRDDIDDVIGDNTMDRWQKQGALADIYLEMVNTAREALGKDPIEIGGKPSALPSAR